METSLSKIKNKFIEVIKNPLAYFLLGTIAFASCGNEKIKEKGIIDKSSFYEENGFLSEDRYTALVERLDSSKNPITISKKGEDARDAQLKYKDKDTIFIFQKNIIQKLNDVWEMKPIKQQQVKLNLLEKYNLENKKVYKSFVDFMITNGERNSGLISYCKKTNEDEIFALIYKSNNQDFYTINLEFYKNNKIQTTFFDEHANGLDINDTYIIKKEKPEEISSFSPEKQLELAQKFTNTLVDLVE